VKTSSVHKIAFIMKFLVVVAALVACAAAKPGAVTYSGFPFATAYNGFAGYHGLPAVSYAAAPALTYAAAPALTYAAAPAVVAPAFSKTQYHAQDELGQASHGYAYPGQAHAVVRDAAGNERGSYAYINPDGNEIRVDYTAGHGGFQVASNALPVAPVHAAALPAPVADTPEVAHAKAAHFAAHAEAKARSHLRKKRGVIAAAPLAAPAVTYSAFAAPALTYAAAAPALHYSALHAPALHYSALAAPAVHHYTAAALAAPAIAAAPAVTYAAAAPAVVAAPTHALRVAELTKVVNNPGHAVSYRVD